MDLGSILSPAGGGSPALALAPNLILQALELYPGQVGQPPHDLLYHLPPSSIVYADTMIVHVRAGRCYPAFALPARCRVSASTLMRPTGSGRATRSTAGRRGPGFSGPHASPTARGR